MRAAAVKAFIHSRLQQSPNEAPAQSLRAKLLCHAHAHAGGSAEALHDACVLKGVPSASEACAGSALSGLTQRLEKLLQQAKDT